MYLYIQVSVIYLLCSILDSFGGYVLLRWKSSFITYDFFYNKQSILQLFYYFQFNPIFIVLMAVIKILYVYILYILFIHIYIYIIKHTLNILISVIYKHFQ